MKKKSKEFSKILVVLVVIIFTVIAIWSMIEYYMLVRLAIKLGSSTLPDSTLHVTCITTILGAILTYCLYQGALKTSLNKNKLKIDKVTGVVKSISNTDLTDAIQQTIEDCDK